MDLKDYITEAVSGRLSTGRKKLSGRELNHDNIVDFLDMCGYEYVGDVTASEMLRDHLNERVYATDGPRKYRDESFKIVVGNDIYYITIPRVNLPNTEVQIRRHSFPFMDISVEDLEKTILDND